MDTDRMIRELRAEAKKHIGDKCFTFQTNITAMCLDVARRLEELMHFKNSISQYYGKGLLIVDYPATNYGKIKDFDGIFKQALEAELKGEEDEMSDVRERSILKSALLLAKEKGDPHYERLAHPNEYMNLVDPVTGDVYSVPKSTALHVYKEGSIAEIYGYLMYKGKKEKNEEE